MTRPIVSRSPGHRRRRAKRYNESVLEAVPGLGPAKRRALLKHFGGLQGVMRAGVADLTQVSGIGDTLARNVYEHLHPGIVRAVGSPGCR